MEIFSGALFGSYSGVADWAPVGGFLFVALAALGLRSGLEHKVNEAIEAKVTWTADPDWSKPRSRWKSESSMKLSER